MGFVAAKCTQCGANIEVDDSKDAGICSHCGTPFVTEKVINNYSITNNVTNNVTNNIANAVFKTGEDETDYYERLVAFLASDDFTRSVKTIREMYEKFPHKALTHLCQADYNASIVCRPGSSTVVRLADFAGMKKEIEDFKREDKDSLWAKYQNRATILRERANAGTNAGKNLSEILNEFYENGLFGFKVLRVETKELCEAEKELSQAEAMMTAEEKQKYADYIRKIRDKIEISREHAKTANEAKWIEAEFRGIEEAAARKKKRKRILGIVIGVAVVVIGIIICVISMK